MELISANMEYDRAEEMAVNRGCVGSNCSERRVGDGFRDQFGLLKKVVIVERYYIL